MDLLSVDVNLAALLLTLVFNNSCMAFSSGDRALGALLLLLPLGDLPFVSSELGLLDGDLSLDDLSHSLSGCLSRTN